MTAPRVVDGSELPAQPIDVAPPRPVASCLRCNVALPLRNMGCRGGHCPNCRHPYPHGDCSD